MAEKKQNTKVPRKSVNGMYHYMGQAWKKPTAAHIDEIRKKMIAWRAGPRIAKIDKPTRIDRARILGYKAKKGFVIFRITLERGGRFKARPRTKRRSKRFSVKKILHMNYQWVAEQRVSKTYRNLEVLNSYKLGKDGRFYFFEVITVDRNAPEIKADPQFSWLTKTQNKFRAMRGLTSSGRKARGMSTKSANLKVRPSLRANNRQGR